MNSVFVRLLLWFCIAALPVQGMAAAMRTCCAPAADISAPVAAASDHSTAHVTTHAGMAHSQHCADMAEPMTPACDHPQTHDNKHDAGSCSACAACCFAAPPAMPTSIVFTPLSLSSAKISLAPLPLFTGHIPGGLERPPRSFLA